MSADGFQRARSPEQKAERRASIVAAAASVHAEAGLDGTTLSAIARCAGLAKSNVYRYFESREHILLSIVHDDWQDWVDALEAALMTRPGEQRTPYEVAAAFVRVTVARPRLCELLSVLSSVLERNVSETAILEFKTKGIGVAMRMVNALHAALPALSVESAVVFTKTMFLVVAALWPAAHTPPQVQAVMARPEFEAMRVDFEGLLQQSSEALLRGLL